MSTGSNIFYLISDGACRGNPGPGGWGMILVTPEGHVTEFGGQETESTNNRMELMGFYRGLQEVFKRAKKYPADTVVAHAISDSKYVLDNAEKFAHVWKRNGWKLASGGEVKNQEMWEKVVKGIEEFKKAGYLIEYELVKGHAGNEGNERADQIAVGFSRNEPVDLYDGALEKYPVNVKTGAAFQPVYLSFVGGQLKRHQTWDQCQKETTGKAGAKFKKVKNRLEEDDALRAWGLK